MTQLQLKVTIRLGGYRYTINLTVELKGNLVKSWFPVLYSMIPILFFNRPPSLYGWEPQCNNDDIFFLFSAFYTMLVKKIHYLLFQ